MLEHICAAKHDGNILYGTCLMGASKSFKINTALAGAYSLAQGTALGDYKGRVEKIVGKIKSRKD